MGVGVMCQGQGCSACPIVIDIVLECRCVPSERICKNILPISFCEESWRDEQQTKADLSRWRARKELAKCQRRWTGPDETSSTGFGSSVILLGVVFSTACARAMLLDLHRDLVMGLPSVIAASIEGSIIVSVTAKASEVATRSPLLVHVS